jgi:hypothetical protein
MKEVQATKLEPGKKYYMYNVKYNIKLCGDFSHNEEPLKNQGTVSFFSNNCRFLPFLILHSKYWQFYERNAVHNAYVNAALRSITGDPSFTFNLNSL